jgi:hypothetical protein
MVVVVLVVEVVVVEPAGWQTVMATVLPLDT